MSLKNIKPMPNLDELRAALRYDPETGFFYCRATGKRKDSHATGDDRSRLCFNGTSYLAHRVAWFYVYGVAPQYTIDHINEVKHDNRIANLQDVPHRENLRLHWERVRKDRELNAPMTGVPSSKLMRPATVRRARDGVV